MSARRGRRQRKQTGRRIEWPLVALLALFVLLEVALLWSLVLVATSAPVLPSAANHQENKGSTGGPE